MTAMLSGGNVEMAVNPTLADDNGFTKPVLKVKRVVNFASTFYFKAFNFDDSLSHVASIKIYSCVNDEVSLVDKSGLSIVHKIQKDKGEQILFTLDYIKSNFKSDDIVSCPIKGYHIVKQDGSDFSSSDDEYSRF